MIVIRTESDPRFWLRVWWADKAHLEGGLVLASKVARSFNLRAHLWGPEATAPWNEDAHRKVRALIEAPPEGLKRIRFADLLEAVIRQDPTLEGVLVDPHRGVVGEFRGFMFNIPRFPPPPPVWRRRGGAATGP